MKNKKGLSLIVTLLMIILLIFVAIGIFWFVTRNIIYPEFKITMNECENKTNYPYHRLTLYVSLGCPHCEKQKSILEENNVEWINTIDCFDYTKECFDKNIMAVPSWRIEGDEKIYKGLKTLDELQEMLNESWEEEICEPILVDEIEIESHTYELNYGYWDCNDVCFWEEGVNYSNDGGKSDWDRIRICQDNCDKEYTYKTPNKTIPKQDLTISWLDENCECSDYCRERYGQIQCPANEERRIEGNYKCSQYNCGNYIVEVSDGK